MCDYKSKKDLGKLNFKNFLKDIGWEIGFGGLEVECWPLVPKFAGSNRPKPSDF